MCKHHLLYRRYLILLKKGGEAELQRFLEELGAGFRLGDVTIHDFDEVLKHPLVIAGLRFHLAAKHERLLNIATFAIDLAQDEDALLAAMNSDYRRKIRIATSRGVSVEAHDKPSPELRASFVAAFNTFARTRGMRPIVGEALGQMYAHGDAMLFVARKRGAISNYLHIYTKGAKAFFMYGVNPSKENDGAGQYLHWRAILRLKEMGLEWYDLGGVAMQDARDGIYNFKSKFGAPIVSLGCEWRSDSLRANSMWVSLKEFYHGTIKRVTALLRLSNSQPVPPPSAEDWAELQ
ncbi:MAG: peptidoglycan bridge formation glycyltransferase FemA/FemB family protein [Methylocystis sp.]